MATQATCAVCLGEFLMVGKKLARHGFNVVTQGLGHGHVGAWHTGPCSGPRFPIFEVSPKGTEWALERMKQSLATEQQALIVFQGRPRLHWQEPQPRKDAWTKREFRLVDVEPGAPADYRIGRQSYDDMLASRIRETEGRIQSLEMSIKHYTQVIADWKPGQTKEVADASRGPAKHWPTMRAAFQVGRAPVRVPLCKPRPQFSGHYPTYAETEAEVTCTRCKGRLAAKSA